MGFENAFDEGGCFPYPGTVIGEDIEILSVDASNGRQELIATCRHADHQHQIALLDIDVNADKTAPRLLAAHRHRPSTQSRLSGHDRR